jgi:N-glycosylase/DNA lyase
MVSARDIGELKAEYARRKGEIQAQLDEFKKVREQGDDRRIFEELVFCILTSAVGPRVGMKSLEAIKDILPEGTAEDTESILKGIHKYPEKAYYITYTRDYLKREYGFRLRELVNSFDDPEGRREFFALNKNIKGLGFTQASHFLRNIGFTGYAILDKNVVKSLYDLGIIDSPKPPTTKKRYTEIEGKMKALADELGIEIDELDMLLWSMKTGRIPI